MMSSNGNIFRVTGLLCGETHRSPVNFPHKGQWHGGLIFFLWSAREKTIEQTVVRLLISVRRHRAHYDVTVMSMLDFQVGVAKRDLEKSHWISSVNYLLYLWRYWAFLSYKYESVVYTTVCKLREAHYVLLNLVQCVKMHQRFCAWSQMGLINEMWALIHCLIDVYMD